MAGRGAASKTAPTKILALEKQRTALELRKAGVSWPVIADEVGYSSPQAACRAVQAAMKELIQEPVLELRTIQIERLNYALMKIWPKVQAGDERAIDTMLRIQERMDRIMGVEMPAQVEHHHEGAVLVIDGNEDAYVAAMERMAQHGGVIDVPSEELPVRTPVDGRELESGDPDQISLFDAADGHTGPDPAVLVPAHNGHIIDIPEVEAKPCARYVRPADQERASNSICARCDFPKDQHG